MHVGGKLLVPNDVVREHVAAFGEPDVRVEAAIDYDVVGHYPSIALSILDSAVKAKVVRDDVVGRSIVQVNIPTVIASPAVISQDDRLDRIEHGQIRHLLDASIHFVDVWDPVAIAPPGVERTVVTGFFDRVEDIAKLHDVAAPAAVADIDSGAWHVVDRAMSDRDVLGEVDLNPGGLLLHPPGQINEAIVYKAVGREVL